MDELKFLAKSLIIDSDLNFEKKKELYGFVCESSDEEEIKAILLGDSPILLEDDTKEIINKRFDIIIEDIITILEQNPPKKIGKEEIEEPKKKGLPFNPANLMYLMYLPSGLRSGILAKIKSVLVAGGGYIGGTAFAALLAYVAFKVYQSYLSKATVSCKDSPDKQTCIINYKKKAKLLQIQQLQKGISQCAKTKNPDKCRVSIQNKINDLRSKIGKVA